MIIKNNTVGVINIDNKHILPQQAVKVDDVNKKHPVIAVSKLYDFLWEELCDWYIEMVKPRLYNSDNQASKDAALWTLKTVQPFEPCELL